MRRMVRVVSLASMPLLVVLLSFTLHPARTSAQTGSTSIVSSFDKDADGWTTVGDAVGAPLPTYVSAGGNPGGYISASDAQLHGRWYWSAPAKFLGNVSTAYLHALTFDLTQSATDNQQDLNDGVILTGQGITLAYTMPYSPNTTWTSYNIPLDPTIVGAWTNRITRLPATQLEMKTVLGSLNSLLIRGEYRHKEDTGGLDNVELGGVPKYHLWLPLIAR